MAVREKYAHLPPLAGDMAQRLERLPELLARISIRAASLFRSAVENPSQSGDIELAIAPDENYSFTALCAQLSRLLNTDRIDLVDLPSVLFWLHCHSARSAGSLMHPPGAVRIHECAIANRSCKRWLR